LIIAAHDGDAATVRRLVEGGAPINATDRAGHTALVIAAEKGRVDIVKLLLSAGADPNITDNMRPKFLSMIVDEGVVLAGIGDVMGAGREEGITPLNSAARFGQAEVVRILLEAGAKVNAKSGKYTPLLLAVVENGRAEIVRLLLEAGAGVDAQGTSGMSPLMKASFNGDAGSVRLLLAHGANVQLKDDEGRTALTWAQDGRVDKDLIALLKQAEVKQRK
jgi:ankyrin repeat protein